MKIQASTWAGAPEPELPVYWEEFLAWKTGNCLGMMNAINLAISQSFTPALMAPLVSLPLCNNLLNGQFVREINDVRSKLSIFRICPKNIGGTRRELRHQNQVYIAMVTGVSTAHMPAVNVLVADNDLDLPNSSEEFRGYVKGYYVLCIGVLAASEECTIPGVTCQALYSPLFMDNFHQFLNLSTF